MGFILLTKQEVISITYEYLSCFTPISCRVNITVSLKLNLLTWIRTKLILNPIVFIYYANTYTHQTQQGVNSTLIS